MPEIDASSDVAALTVQLLSAYLTNNTVASEDLAELIRSTKSALTEEAEATAAQPVAETFTPAVSIRKSLASPEHIISLIDGKPYKTLKRHLASRGLTPDEYRSRYNLPASYPMVAPAYAAHRRHVAQKIGLGVKKPGVKAQDDQQASPLPDVVDQEAPGIAAPSALSAEGATPAPPIPKKRGRKPKAQRLSGDTIAQASVPSDGAAAPDNAPEENAAPDDAGAKQPAKHPGSSRKKPAGSRSAKSARATKAASATKADTAIVAETPPADPASDAPGGGEAERKRKVGRPRAKIGLFSKPSNPDAEPSANSETPGRPKRMARTPKPPEE